MTSQTDPKTIELYGYGCQHEATALGTITPGMLVERASGGVQAHSTAGGPANTQFANEYALTGRTIDDDYSTDDQVIFNSYGPGAGIYALLATANDITEGDFLASNGDGALKAVAADEVAVAQALEDLNNTSGSNSRIRVEVINTSRTAP